jgi:2-polyprenyl-3-methyl-5-hydroxy-6-metoxy-1,4-benzoquinol methylase
MRARPCVLCEAADAAPFFDKDGYRLVRCGSCGLVFVANPPSPDELRRFYSFAEGYAVESRDDPDEICRLEALARRHADALARRSRPPGRLLDVGCSAGFFLAAARERGWTVTGVELNADAAGLARDRLGLDVVVGELAEAPVRPGSFDAVTFWDVLEHVPDPADALRAAHRLLRPGGTLALSTPNLDGLFPRLSRPVGHLTGYWTHPEPPAHLFQFSRRTLGRLLGATGFDVLEVLHERTPLKYTLAPGGLRRVARSPWRALYVAAFVLPLLAGPVVRMGDEIVVFAIAKPR